MYHRILKGATSLAYLLLIALTWRWFKGETHWNLALGAALVSGFWLVLTVAQMHRLLKTYFDVLSRLAVLVPLTLGLVLSGLAIALFDSLAPQLVASGELLAWLGVYLLYRRNRRLYKTQGHGPLPKGCWVNPDPSVIAPGDLVLTSGRIASTIQESVGHGEIGVRLADGRMGLLSSYMEKGTVLNDLSRVVGKWRGNGTIYIVLKLRTPLTQEQSLRATEIAQQMLAANAAWRERENARRARLIGFLPLPAAWKSRLVARTRATGYDWPGLFIGHLHANRWTCIGACLELLHRLGVKTNHYGTGLLGIGTGLLDPIMPVRFLCDPAFRLVTLDDKKELSGA